MIESKKEGPYLKILFDIAKDSLTLIEKAIKSINENKVQELDFISNQTTNNASAHQDEISIKVALIVLSMYKLDEEARLKRIKIDAHKFAEMLSAIHHTIEQKDLKKFRKQIQMTNSYLKRLGESIGHYNILDRSGVKKGGKLYDHGISLAQSANKLNVSQWELYEYVGKNSNDYPEDVDKRVKHRLNYTRKLFN